MKLALDPQLVEEAVHLLARADERRWRAYRRTVDPLYDAPDRDRHIPDALHGLFREWGALHVCEEAAALAPGAGRALVARSQRPGDEGADLLVGGGASEDPAARTLLLRLAPEQFLDLPRLRTFLRHELRHVADMLDPSFGYEPDLGLSGRTRGERELVRARYRVLWDVAIDRVEASPVAPAERQVQLDRAFGALEPAQRERIAACFAGPEARRHATLAAAARDPWTFLGEPRRGPAKGLACPLCGFPTYDWETDPPVELLRRDFPAWGPSDGVCRQCCDLARAAAAPA